MCVSGRQRYVQEDTYRGVDGLIAIEVTVLAETVMGLAKGDTGNTAGDQAGVDGGEAAKEGVVPGLGRLGRLGVDMLAGAGEDVVEAILPLVEVVVVNGTVVVGVLSRGSHCERYLFEEKIKSDENALGKVVEVKSR
jgi:hypothetical protein